MWDAACGLTSHAVCDLFTQLCILLPQLMVFL